MSADRTQSNLLAKVVSATTAVHAIVVMASLLVPVLAALLGFANSFRMVRLPDPVSSGAAEGMLAG